MLRVLVCVYHKVLQEINNVVTGMSENRGTSRCTMFVAFMLIISLSFHYVEYDEIVLKKQNLVIKVNLDETFEVGRYYWEVTYTPVTFPRQFQKVKETYSIFPTNGLEFDVDVVFWYRIQPENLGPLFKAFGKSFESQVINHDNAKIKNVAPNFDITRRLMKFSWIFRLIISGLDVLIFRQR
jgi:hypothetical protein